MLFFAFITIQLKHFLIFLLISSLSYELFKMHCLFSKYLGGFLGILLFLIFNLILLCSGNILCKILIFCNLIKLILWPQHMVYFGEHSCALERNVCFEVVHWAFWKCQLSRLFIALFRSFISLLILSSFSVNYWGRGVKIWSYDQEITYFSLSYSQFLIYEFWSSVIRCKNVKIFMIFCWVKPFVIMICTPLSVKMLLFEVYFVLF